MNSKMIHGSRIINGAEYKTDELKVPERSIPIVSFSSFSFDHLPYIGHGSKKMTSQTSGRNSKRPGRSRRLRKTSKKDSSNSDVMTNSISSTSHDITRGHTLSGTKERSIIHKIHMKNSIIKILIITATLMIAQGIFITFFYMIGSILFDHQSFGFAFIAWILSIMSLSIIAEIFGDKKISLSIQNEIE